jgi:hypothetical protein
VNGPHTSNSSGRGKPSTTVICAGLGWAGPKDGDLNAEQQLKGVTAALLSFIIGSGASPREG